MEPTVPYNYEKALDFARDVIILTSMANPNLSLNRGHTKAIEKIAEIWGVDLTITDKYPELRRVVDDLYGVADEEIRAKLIKPLWTEQRKQHAGKQMQQEWVPTFYNYDFKPYYFKYSTTKREYNAVSRGGSDAVKFALLARQAIYASYALQLSSNEMQFVGDLIKRVLEINDGDHEVFDPSKEYKETNNSGDIRKIQYLKKSKDSKVYGAVQHDITANQFTDWDNAVKNGYIAEMNLVTESIKRPGTGNSNVQKKLIMEDFAVAYLNVCRELTEMRKPGLILSGETAGDVSKNNYVFYVRPGILEELQGRFLPTVMHNEMITFPIKIKPMDSFGDLDNTPDNKRVWGVIVDVNNNYIKSMRVEIEQDNYGEAGFQNICTFWHDRAHVSGNSIIHVFRDPEE